MLFTRPKRHSLTYARIAEVELFTMRVESAVFRLNENMCAVNSGYRPGQTFSGRCFQLIAPNVW